MQLIPLSILCLITLSTLLSAHRARRALRRFRLIPDGLITSSESIHHIGYSIICTSVHSVSHIEELLSKEYDHYEVIVTIDSAKHPKAFRHIVSHFHLIEVSNLPCEELPSASMRRLFRSAKRPLRQVLLIDKRSISEYDDLNAAVAVATYDYLIPMGAEDHLYPNAFEVATSAISQWLSQDAEPELIYSQTLAESYIFEREKLIELGGFSAHIISEFAPKNRLRLDLPLGYRTPTFHTTLRQTIPPLLLPAIVAPLAFGIVPSLAIVSTLILQWACAARMTEFFGSKKCSGWSKLYYLSRKWDFFRPRKFTVS